MKPAVALWAILWAGYGIAAEAPAEQQTARIDVAHQVQDPAYGQVLYHYYQGQYFAAMSRIMVALERGEMPTQSRRARVLLGSLYANYGMPTEARALFEELIAETVSDELAARIWLHLAEIEYRGGGYADALDLLDTHLQEVPRQVQSKHRTLRTRVLMKLGRYDETAALLGNLADQTPLSGYLRYNLAVSRINAGQGDQGTALLWQLANLPPGDDEINALKDKAMLALGVHYLRADQAQQARAVMEAARLDGPYSELALLLHGRAWLASDQPGKALPSLLALGQRSLQLQETQEALLALPFVYDQLGDFSRAQAAYRDAIDRYTRHFAYLNELQAHIDSGAWFAEVAPRPAWSTSMDPLPPFEPVRVSSFASFRQLFASDRFQHYWRAWHEQSRQLNLLGQWKGKLPVMNQLLAAHVARYRDTLPLAEQLVEEVAARRFGEQLAALGDRYDQARQARDMEAFASGRELVWLDALSEAQSRAQRWSGRIDPELADRVDFYQRVLQWELSKDEVPRFWERQRQLAELEALLARHGELAARVGHAAAGMSEGVYARGELLANMNNGLYQLLADGETLQRRIQQEIEGQALQEIRLTRERLRYYIAECWAALAELEHRAVNLKRRYVPVDQSEASRSEE